MFQSGYIGYLPDHELVPLVGDLVNVRPTDGVDLHVVTVDIYTTVGDPNQNHRATFLLEGRKERKKKRNANITHAKQDAVNTEKNKNKNACWSTLVARAWMPQVEQNNTISTT